MIASVFAALLATAGLTMVYRLAVPARPPLAADLARLLKPTPAPTVSVATSHGRLVQHLTATAAHRGLISEQLRQDLLVADRPIEWLVARSLATGAALAGIVAALGLVLTVGGLGLSPLLLIVVGAAGAVGGVLVPPYLLRQEATDQRMALRVFLPGFLDLTGILLAAGNSLESALRTAAISSDDWPHQQVQHALYAAAVSRQPAAEALQDLGTRLGIDELSQLGDGLLMAEREGASMRASLSARARGLRERQLSDAEARAGSATEGMSFPLVAFVFGFILLIGYPALIGLSTGLGSR